METTPELKEGAGGEDLKELLEMEETLKRRLLDIKRQLAEVNLTILKKEDRAEHLKRDIKTLKDQGHLGFPPELILPKEIWNKILKNLKDDSDMAKCRMTCKLFKNLLPPPEELEQWEADPSRNDFIVAHESRSIQLKIRQGSVEDDNASEAEKLRNRLRQKFNKFKLSRPWSGFEVVDYVTRVRHQQNRLVLRSLEYPSKIHEVPRELSVVKSFNYSKTSTETDQESFWQYVRKYMMRNDLVIPSPHPIPDFTKFIRFIPTLSSKLGYHHKYQFFTRDLFKLCPGLEELCIGGQWDEKVIPPTSAKTFPPATGLEKLQVLDGIESVAVIQALLERFSAQIKILEITKWRNVSHFNWNALEELHLSKIESGEDLKQLASIDLPHLKNLCLHVTKVVSCNDIVKILDHLGAAANKKFLLQLKISEKAKIDHVLTPDGTLFATKLKNLELHFASSSPEDFLLLLRFPFLENLKIHSRPLKNVDFSEVVEVHKFFHSREMYRSNIWKLLPYLEEIACGKENHFYKRKAPE